MIKFILGVYVGYLLFGKKDIDKGRIVHCKMPTYKKPDR